MSQGESRKLGQYPKSRPHALSASGQPLLLLDAPLFTLCSQCTVSIDISAICELSESGIQRVLTASDIAEPGVGNRKNFTNYRQVLTSYEQRGGSMERRYLVATLALVATFAVFSHEFRSGHLDNLPCLRAELKSEIACAKHYLADQLMAKLRPFVDRNAPEEPQMLAELNLPTLAAANEKVAETAGASCAADRRAQLRGRAACPGACASRPGTKPPRRRTCPGAGSGNQRPGAGTRAGNQCAHEPPGAGNQCSRYGARPARHGPVAFPAGVSGGIADSR